MKKHTRKFKSEVVTINDRGPFIEGRIIDVTSGIFGPFFDYLGFLPFLPCQQSVAD